MMKRREFLGTGIAAGTGFMMMTRAVQAAQEASKPASDAVHVGLIGAGDQGNALIQAGLAMPDIRFRAICDIWEYRRQTAKKYLATYKHDVNDYADYRQMLDKEKDLHAVIVATPDFVHAEQVIACLKAGLNVYCEAAMANTIDAGRSMVKAMRETGKLLQIGYQRRSNPRYKHVLYTLLGEAQLVGQLTNVSSQWAHRVREDLGWPRKFAMPDDQLKASGFDSMRELRNWRAFKKYGLGELADSVAHQIDVSNWLIGVRPKSVTATGGVDYYKDHQTHDNVTAVLEYPTSKGTVRSVFQLLTTTSAGGGSFEHFMGTESSIRISENPRWTKIFREPYAPDWERWTEQNFIVKEVPPAVKAAEASSKPMDPHEIRSQETGQVTAWELPVVLDKSPWQPHLENFVAAVRGKAKLNCPADVAFPTEVLVFKVNEAIEARKTIDLKPEDFAV